MRFRADLQAIRGLAITFVLAFHLMPEHFRLGFVGVDMFFVLSGFLICGMVRGSKVSLKDTLTNFYLRRFRRIVPLYYIVIAATFIATSFFVIVSDRYQVVRDLKWSMGFASNMQPILERRDYWELIDSHRFFVHTWSLGVELQFYLVAPFLYMAVRDCDRAIVLHGFVAVCSLLFQIFTSKTVSYGLMFSRLWQFNAGALVAILLEKEERNRTMYRRLPDGKNCTENNEAIIPLSNRYRMIVSSLLTICAIVLLWINPDVISEQMARLVYTMLTAVVIYFGSDLLSNATPLIRFGDWSYTAYLIHWPIIVGFKYHNSLTEIGCSDLNPIIATVVALSWLIHVVVEKRLITASYSKSAAVCLCCLIAISANWSLYDQDVLLLEKPLDTEEMKAAIEFNTNQSIAYRLREGGVLDLEAFRWTNVMELDDLRGIAYGDGSLKVLMLGHSIAYRLQPLIYDILQPHMKELRLWAKNSCYGLPGTQDDGGSCDQFINTTREIIDKSRPDIIIYAAPWTPECNYENQPEKVQSYAKALQQFVTFASQRCRVMVIELPYALAGVVGPEIARRLYAGKSLDDLKMTKKEAYNTRKVQKAIMLNLTCSNCVFSATDDAIFEGDYYYFYNRKNLKAYTHDGFHFTSEGLELIRKHYTKLLGGIVKNLGESNKLDR